VTGLAVTAVLALLALASASATAAARSEALSDGRNPAVYATYTGRAMATVLDVTPDPARPGRVTTTVAFVPDGGERTATYVTLDDRLPPRVGDELEIAFDPAQPEHAAPGIEVLRYAENAGGLGRIAAEEEPPGFVPAAVTGLLAMAALGGTVLRATRGPRRAPR
jgi:hypothetical protein